MDQICRLVSRLEIHNILQDLVGVRTYVLDDDNEAVETHEDDDSDVGKEGKEEEEEEGGGYRKFRLKKD